MTTSSIPENLEGWIPTCATPDEIRLAFETAFSYRGDVTVTLKDGRKLEGYIFDRQTGNTLENSFFKMLPADQSAKVSISYSQVAALAFTGRDTAAGKSFETWIKKYNEKKAAGEKNIQLTPDPLI